ncbi:hypothetical protein [Flavobacterium piscis]|uniref:DUF304 domain-containing protein n=1 Tax=Flavobacterium piscis TaxID=1114874 RepID=A0ABU1YA84_9FLAO|nr:hypothetical protein [Flavobacterium piscis]MDR7210565.1 hypothetical protein [Flavobacterium piscis]
MKTIKTNFDNTICLLPSIIFNNKKTINPFFISLLLIPFFLYSKDNQYFIYFALFALSILVLLFLIAPLKLILSSSGIQYHIFWKIKWSNFKSYTINNGTLTIKSKDGKEKTVKNLDKTISEKVDDFINEKINVTK